MTNLSYTVFEGLQWNSRRGLARFARQLRRHLEAAGWHDHPAAHAKWSSPLGRILISEVVEPYQQRRLRSEIAFYPHNVLPSWISRRSPFHVLVLHDVLFLEGENFKGLGNRYRSLKLGHSLREADLILTVSEASRIAIQKLLPRDLSVFVIPNCLAESFSDLKLAARLPADVPKTILHFGGHAPSKNTFALMRAVAQLVHSGMDVRLEVAAMANQAVLFERWRNAVDLPQGSCRLLPLLNDEQLVDAYRRADLHAMPSTGEGFGIPVIEAASTGTLNVLTPLGVFREMIGEGAIYATGFDSEAIAAALRAALAADRQSLVSRAYERTSQYTFESVHENYAKPALEHIAMLARSRRDRNKEGR